MSALENEDSELSRGYLYDVSRARRSRQLLRLRRFPKRLVRWVGSGFKNPFIETSAVGATKAAHPEGANEWWLDTTVVRNQMKSERCCAFAVTGAMETRIVSGQHGPANTEVLASDLWKSTQKRSLYATVDKAGLGVLDAAGSRRVAKCIEIVEDSDTALRERMVQLLQANRPLAIRVQIFGSFFKFKGDGIYGRCGTAFKGDHAICLVGFGASATGQRYWIAKNSFDSTWGDAGFVRIAWGDNDVQPEAVVFSVSEVTP